MNTQTVLPAQEEGPILHPRRNIPIFIRRDPLKRAFDILFSLAVLIFTSPLFLILTLFVRCSSKGPIFFKDRRLGRGGEMIDCYKFRTMHPNAQDRLIELLKTNAVLQTEWNTFRKIKLDPRITPIGRFLRRTSLDELPQFWNVLKGDLSVVGPRPPTLLSSPDQFLEEIKAIYGDKAPIILSVRPGITGVWQTSGRSKISSQQKAAMEASYAETRTFLQDLILIFKTIPAVLLSRGAQ